MNRNLGRRIGALFFGWRANIVITPEAKEEILRDKFSDPTTKAVRLKVGYNGSVFGYASYHLEPQTSDRIENHVLHVIDGIPILVEKDHIPFLDGLVIEYCTVFRPGIDFSHPDANLDLLKEYRTVTKIEKEEADSQRLMDTMIVARYKPEILVQDVLVKNSTDAFKMLYATWRHRSPETFKYGELYGSVRASYRTANASGEDRIIMVIQSANFDGRYSLMSLANLQGGPERFLLGDCWFNSNKEGVYKIGGTGCYIVVKFEHRSIREGGPKSPFMGSCEEITVVALTGEQRRLLTINYDFGLSAPKGEWVWHVDDSRPGEFRIALYHNGADEQEWEYCWNDTEQRFTGPASTPEAGFFAGNEPLDTPAHQESLRPYFAYWKRETETPE